MSKPAARAEPLVGAVAFSESSLTWKDDDMFEMKDGLDELKKRLWVNENNDLYIE